MQSGFTERYEVRQFQFTAWPDHGVPDNPSPLLIFMRRVKAMQSPDAGPIVVHCRCVSAAFTSVVPFVHKLTSFLRTDLGRYLWETARALGVTALVVWQAESK